MLGAFLVACLGGGVLAAIATSHSVATWYPTLAKPSWTPPGWLFAPVWTTLYVAMAVAGWRVWRRVGWGRALTSFAVQLALNVAWSFLFFGLRQPVLGMIDIAALWLAIVVTLASFGKIDRPAAWLLVPYLAWVSFASALNLSIALHN
ncbi:MAG TPA: TspO/MBR family protein [Kofleriaceae bacterium]|nr:TspO/MBR family protein [Kofleriaceae bacterium]